MGHAFSFVKYDNDKAKDDGDDFQSEGKKQQLLTAFVGHAFSFVKLNT